MQDKGTGAREASRGVTGPKRPDKHTSSWSELKMANHRYGPPWPFTELSRAGEAKVDRYSGPQCRPCSDPWPSAIRSEPEGPLKITNPTASFYR